MKPCLCPSRKKDQVSLFYKDYADDSPEKSNFNNDDDISGSVSEQLEKISSISISSFNAIPIVGPLYPQAPPLLVGAETYLSNPTPLQWRTLEECVLIHESKQSIYDHDENNILNATSITSAPIVAILDEYSGRRSMPNGKRYATIAAILGISGDSRENQGYDESFMEFVSRMKMDGGDSEYLRMLSQGSKVRFIGIGRAVIGELSSYNTETAEELYDHEDDNDDSPIIMAEFQLLRDTGVLSFDQQDSFNLPTDPYITGGKSRFMSPAHALSKLNTYANKLNRKHDARRKLISGLRAANIRLQNSLRKRMEEELNDYDGIGMLSSFYEDDTPPSDQEDLMTIDEFLVTYDSPLDIAQTPEKLISDMENYGVNYYSAFASLPDLTNQALDTLKPYYSPKNFASDDGKDGSYAEEFYYEIMSFVAWRALDGYVDEEEIAWALKTRSTSERLVRAAELMLNHRIELEKLAGQISAQLKDCGEECTDLW
eukprot:CAMPEP_0178956810 /NCGR_PEP_ID=MMETSP0789-20121207/10499_1 /TAXON_ID=3005 /ORGANISM="Rhizosolenia setigera, Strain CCMP 1694" /LENGTH=485 /DNA_ID=CAMNT_0020638857 /DNA_START=225 /DNA_END=1682 /DNA_ORIENTATION=-